MLWILLLTALPLGLIWLARTIGPRKLRWVVGWLLPAGTVIGGLLAAQFLSVAARFVLSTVVLLWMLKGTVLLLRPREDVRGFSWLALGVYFFGWPGMALEPFRRRAAGLDFAGWRVVRGAAWCVIGMVALVYLARNAGGWSEAARGWAAVFLLLFTIHLGFADVLTWLVRRLGFDVAPAFDEPLASASLNDFWSRRWNRPFIELDRLLFFRPLLRAFGATGAVLGVFVFSGLLHEFAISYPAGGGTGWPLLYFVLQGVLVLIENRLKGKLPAWVFRVGAWVGVLGPLPLLFHAAFRREVLLAFLDVIAGL